MQQITSLLPLNTGDKIAIIGSGGKTTLLWQLAKHAIAPCVMATTTTHMQRQAPIPCRLFLQSANQLRAALPLQPGVYFCGTIEPVSGKLSSLPNDELAYFVQQMDAAVMESDGSRTLPLKGWAPHEPVIPPFTTHTVGVIPLWALGKPATEEHIHRFAIFKELTGIQPNQPIGLQHIAAAIFAPNGLFAKAVGKRVLFINQIEDEAAFALARQLVSLLPAPFMQTVECIIAGSARQNWGEILWKRP